MRYSYIVSINLHWETDPVWCVAFAMKLGIILVACDAAETIDINISKMVLLVADLNKITSGNAWLLRCLPS